MSRHSPAYPAFPSPDSSASSEGRSQHSHGHGHGSHGHKRSLKRAEQAALLKSQYINPVLPGLPPVLPHTSPAGGSQQMHGAGFITAGAYQTQQTGSAHVTATGSPAPDPVAVALWGEAESGGRSVVGHKQPVRPLLCDGWKVASVTCSVPRLYQPAGRTALPATVGEASTSVSTAVEHPRDWRGYNLILHSMDMQQHVQALRQLLSSVQAARPAAGFHSAVPPIPTRFWTPPSKKEEQQQQRLQTASLLAPPDHRLPKVCLDQTALYLLLRKSAAAITAHVGYESSSSCALDTITDILGDFLSRIAKVMRTNADQQAERGSIGFQDVVDRSLHECGIEGKGALQAFWQSSVKVPTIQLQQAAIEMREEYQRIVDPMGESSGAGRKSLSTASTSLSLASKRSRRESTDFRFLSPWLAVTPGDPASDAAEEEISLDSVMQHANLDNVALVRTPDLGGPVAFSQISDSSSQEAEGFTPLVVDGPARKRLRTMSLSTE